MTDDVAAGGDSYSTVKLGLRGFTLGRMEGERMAADGTILRCVRVRLLDLLETQAVEHLFACEDCHFGLEEAEVFASVIRVAEG